MAEAATEARNRYFCHKCTQQINPVLPDYTCPRCRSGFIEELALNAGTTSATSQSSSEDDGIAGLAYSEIMRAIIDGYGLGSTNYGEDGAFQSTSSGQGRQNTGRGENTPIVIPHNAGRFNSHRRGGSERGVAPLERGETETPDSLSIVTSRPSGFAIPLVQQIFVNLAEAAGGSGNNEIPLLFNFHGNPGDYVWGSHNFDAVIAQLMNRIEGSGPPPLPKDKIDEIPMVPISQEQVDSSMQCTVCMEDFIIGELVKKLNCQHHFHTSCIVPWLELHGTCPICRMDFSNDDNTNPRMSGEPRSEEGPDTSTESVLRTTTSSRGSNTTNPNNYDFLDEFD